MIATLFRAIRQFTERGRFRNEIHKQLEAFAEGEINDIEGAIVLARTGVAEAVPALHRALIRSDVFALCQSEVDPKSYVSVRSSGNFRAYVVFTTRARAESALSQARDGIIIEQPFYHVLHAAPVGVGIVINPMDVAVRLDIDPSDVARLENLMIAEAEAMQARKMPTEPPPLPARAKVDPSRPVRLSVGPSPWAWRDRSHILGGTRYRFRDLTGVEKLSGITTVLNERDETILLLDFQLYARFLDDGRVLLWWEEGEKDSKKIAFASFTFESLKVIDQPVEAAKQMRERKAKTAGLDGIDIIRFQCFLEAGSHKIGSRVDWKDFEETLVLADYAPGSNGYDVMYRALFVFDWINQQVTVIPQDWFNNRKYDFGYQWIARIARTESGSLIGEGIRLGTFKLDESGREVEDWLTQNPFHMIQ